MVVEVEALEDLGDEVEAEMSIPDLVPIMGAILELVPIMGSLPIQMETPDTIMLVPEKGLILTESIKVIFLNWATMFLTGDNVFNCIGGGTSSLYERTKTKKQRGSRKAI